MSSMSDFAIAVIAVVVMVLFSCMSLCNQAKRLAQPWLLPKLYCIIDTSSSLGGPGSALYGASSYLQEPSLLRFSRVLGWMSSLLLIHLNSAFLISQTFVTHPLGVSLSSRCLAVNHVCVCVCHGLQWV